MLTYLEKRPFLLTTDEILSMISQWLEGLATLSEKGIHGDLSSSNLLLKRGGKEKVEAVISDFGVFLSYGKKKYEVGTKKYCTPEYFAEKRVTSKRDVWAMGICLHRIFSKERIPFLDFKEVGEMVEWISKLRPDWVLKYPTKPNIPSFLLDLINEMLDPMLDPRLDHRPSAKEAFERFSKSQSVDTHVVKWHQLSRPKKSESKKKETKSQ